MGTDGMAISKAETFQVLEDRKQMALMDELGWRKPQASIPLRKGCKWNLFFPKDG